MHARIMLGLLLAFQLADAATFVFGVGLHGIALESNGFASLAYRWHGLDGVLLLKGAALVLTLGVLVAGATRFPRMFVWGAAAATGLGLLGLASNVTSLVLLSSVH
ncbi:MAG TPA: hypothetical protein VIH33_02125 [Candidatus Limnocylindria bacterium]|jgi:hypothetical protein